MAFEIEGFEITEEMVKSATATFKKYDKKANDSISTSDLAGAFVDLRLNLKGDKLKELADEADTEATGFIELEGFLLIYGKQLKAEADFKDLKEAFRVLDKEKTGEIGTDDLKWLMRQVADDDMTDDDIDDMIREVDSDGSGAVDFEEFYKLMTSD